jgi:hypothetical protein
MKEKFALVLGTGTSLLGIALVANGIEQLQSGPRWEVPAAAATNWILLGIISILLYLAAIFSYFRGNRFASQTPASRVGFWALLCIGVVLTILSYALDPGQWPITHRNSSAVARRSSIPISVACGVIWIFLVTQTRNTPSSDE